MSNVRGLFLSPDPDAFFVAFKLPNLFRRIFAEGAFAVAFVPVLSEYKETREFSDLQSFVNHVAGVLGLVTLGISLLGVIAGPLLIAIFAPGWYFGETGNAALAGEMLRLTFPYLFFISLTAFAGAILNTHNRFGVPAFTPVLLNLCLIGAAYWLAPLFEQPVMGLAWGVFIAGAAQLAFNLPFLHQLRLLPKPVPSLKDPGVRKVLRLMGPAVFGASATQIGLLLNTLIASLLIEGSISWLYYSDRLLEFPVGILGAALATVVLPNLSRTYQTSSREEFSALIDWGVRWVVLIGLSGLVAHLSLTRALSLAPATVVTPITSIPGAPSANRIASASSMPGSVSMIAGRLIRGLSGLAWTAGSP